MTNACNALDSVKATLLVHVIGLLFSLLLTNSTVADAVHLGPYCSLLPDNC